MGSAREENFFISVQMSGIFPRRTSSEEKHDFDRACLLRYVEIYHGKAARNGALWIRYFAARILRNMVDENGDGLYRQIYEAERQYVMTRGFWND